MKEIHKWLEEALGCPLISRSTEISNHISKTDDYEDNDDDDEITTIFSNENLKNKL